MSDRSIRDAVLQMTGLHLKGQVYSVDCTILSVDESKRTCRVRVVSGKANNEFTARLMSAIDDGVFVVPAVDSTVCVIVSDAADPYVSQFSEVDKIILKGGDYGGLVRVKELTTKLNNLEKAYNDLVQKFNTHVHPGVQSGGSSTATTATPETKVLIVTQRKDIENESITHGS